MKLKEIYKSLLLERRTQKISESQARSYFEEEASKLWHPDKNTHIYRGVSGFDHDFGFVDPKSGDRRKSKNSENYYTLLIDNLSDWQKYPDRGQSLICSTSASYAGTYGGTGVDNDAHLVIPIKKGKIAICPEDDIWRSFETIRENFASSMNEFNKLLYMLSSYVLGTPHIPEESFSEFKSHIQKMDRVGRERKGYLKI